MAINYCDWVVGDDVTGDGTFGSPYKTIDMASTGLTGGDEVRVAKSPADTDLSGTLDFVNDSNLINTSEDLTGELSPGDHFYKNSNPDDIHEIISLTFSQLTLFKKYYGTTETVSGKKLGVTNTNEASGIYDIIQEVSSSGVSTSSRLKISGGWDLSTQIQNGFTYFKQMHSTLTYRYGYGLYINTKNYLEIEKLGFLRYTHGLEFAYSNNNKINIIKCFNNNYSGINLDHSNYNIINNIICNRHNENGLTILFNAENNIINNPICDINSQNGIYIFDANNNIINNSICNINSQNGIYLYNITNNIINTPTCNNNLHSGIYIPGCEDCEINTPICNDNNYNGIYINNSPYIIINNAICNDNNYNGIHLYSLVYYCIINTATCNNNNNYGIELEHAFDNIINSVTSEYNKRGLNIHQVLSERNVFNNIICNNNTNYGICVNYCNNNIFNNLICDINTEYNIYISGCIDIIINKYSGTETIYIDSWNSFHERPLLKIQNCNGSGDNRIYYSVGILSRNIAEARSVQCLKYAPTSNEYYISQKFNFTILKLTEKIISFYIKDDVAFDGDVQAALFFMEENITDWTEITTTAGYNQHTLIATSENITEDGVLELRIKARGTTGNVYVDDLGVI